MKLVITLAAVLFSAQIFAQDCAVEKESLKGTYTGDCKKGKANGKGKAVGADTYEGEFKNGLPDGQGTYTYSNGNVFKGSFSKGLKQGEGSMTYKRTGKSDSTIKGFWSKDLYVGLYEKPYTIYTKGEAVNDVDVKYQKEGMSQITFVVSDASGGGFSAGGTQRASGRVDNIQRISGERYGQVTTNERGKKTETIINEVTFPLRIKVFISGEELEMEFREPGSYTVNVNVNK